MPHVMKAEPFNTSAAASDLEGAPKIIPVKSLDQKYLWPEQELI